MGPGRTHDATELTIDWRPAAQQSLWSSNTSVGEGAAHETLGTSVRWRPRMSALHGHWPMRQQVVRPNRVPLRGKVKRGLAVASSMGKESSAEEAQVIEAVTHRIQQEPGTEAMGQPWPTESEAARSGRSRPNSTFGLTRDERGSRTVEMGEGRTPRPEPLSAALLRV